MNKEVLKKAQKSFLKEYPGGFENPKMLEIAKKHGVEKISKQVKEGFTKEIFEDPKAVLDLASKIASRSSLISMFEKPKFKSLMNSLKGPQSKKVSNAIYELLHGDKDKGFEDFSEFLISNKMGKWPLVTFLPYYYRPKMEVFVKPTTTKQIIEKLDLDLKYASKPTLEFYKLYKKDIKRLMKDSPKELKPDTAAFCGFLMMSLN